MLPRVLEPEVMDSLAEAEDYDSMDHGQVNRLFVADFLSAWTLHQPAPTGELLDLGTGTAQIPIELCRQHSSARVRAVDMAGQMLTVAARNVAAAALQQRIFLERTDAKQLPYADGRFPAVLSNSIVHHIAEPLAVLAEAVRVVAPGGLMFVRDLLRPADALLLARLVDTYAAGANAHQRQMFADSLHAALTLNEIQAMVAALGLDPDGVRQTSDRHWTWAAGKAT